MNPVKAKEDFIARVEAYQKRYQTIEDFEDHSHIRSSPFLLYSFTFTDLRCSVTSNSSMLDKRWSQETVLATSRHKLPSICKTFTSDNEGLPRFCPLTHPFFFSIYLSLPAENSDSLESTIFIPLFSKSCRHPGWWLPKHDRSGTTIHSWPCSICHGTLISSLVYWLERWCRVKTKVVNSSFWQELPKFTRRLHFIFVFKFLCTALHWSMSWEEEICISSRDKTFRWYDIFHSSLTTACLAEISWNFYCQTKRQIELSLPRRRGWVLHGCHRTSSTNYHR